MVQPYQNGKASIKPNQYNYGFGNHTEDTRLHDIRRKSAVFRTIMILTFFWYCACSETLYPYCHVWVPAYRLAAQGQARLRPQRRIGSM